MRRMQGLQVAASSANSRDQTLHGVAGIGKDMARNCGSEVFPDEKQIIRKRRSSIAQHPRSGSLKIKKTFSRTPSRTSSSDRLESLVETMNRTTVAGSYNIDVMPDDTRVIQAGQLYKLTSGHVQKWELRETFLTKDKLSYCLDANATNAWNENGLRVAESIRLFNVDKIVSDADRIVQQGIVSKLSTCWQASSMSYNMHTYGEVLKHRQDLLDKSVRSARAIISHMGVVMTRGQLNTESRTLFFVLSEEILECYEDENAYLSEKEGGLIATLPTKVVKVTLAAPRGAADSDHGYHFTIVNTADGKVIECACEDEESRDLWVQKIEACYHNSVVHGARVNIAVYCKPEKEDTGLMRVHYFHAENEQECLTWTKALREAVVNSQKSVTNSLSLWSRMRMNLKEVYRSTGFQFAVVGVIIANFFVNVVEFEIVSSDPAVIAQFDHLDIFFTGLFSLELLLNLCAHLEMLPFPFLSDGWNILDTIIVTVSLMAAVGNTLSQDGGVRAIRVLRSFRVIRVFPRLIALRSIVKALVNSIKPVLNTFFVMLISTSVYAILGVGMFGNRPKASRYFGHFSEAFFTMFQCAAGDGWGSGVARPMFESAEETCTYRDEETGSCVFDVGVACFFASYILIVVTVILNVVFAVLIDQFLKAQDEESRLKAQEIAKPEEYYNDKSVRGFSGPLDPFLKYLTEFQNSDEMEKRIQKTFDFFDYNNNGVLDFLEVKMGLERLNLTPMIELMEEDWRDITNHGELCGGERSDTLTSEQFSEVMRNQVTLYVQRVASKTLAQEQNQKGKEDEQSTTFVLKYLVTAVDDLRSAAISAQTRPSTIEYRAQRRGGGRKARLLWRAKHKRRHGLSWQRNSAWPVMAEAVDTQPEVNSTCESNKALTDLDVFKTCICTCRHAFEQMLLLCPSQSHRLKNTFDFSKFEEVMLYPPQMHSTKAATDRTMPEMLSRFSSTRADFSRTSSSSSSSRRGEDIKYNPYPQMQEQTRHGQRHARAKVQKQETKSKFVVSLDKDGQEHNSTYKAYHKGSSSGGRQATQRELEQFKQDIISARVASSESHADANWQAEIQHFLVQSPVGDVGPLSLQGGKAHGQRFITADFCVTSPCSNAHEAIFPLNNDAAIEGELHLTTARSPSAASRTCSIDVTSESITRKLPARTQRLSPPDMLMAQCLHATPPGELVVQKMRLCPGHGAIVSRTNSLETPDQLFSKFA